MCSNKIDYLQFKKRKHDYVLTPSNHLSWNYDRILQKCFFSYHLHLFLSILYVEGLH